MDILIPLVLFGVGLGLIIFFAEQLVKGVVGTSVGFGLSTFGAMSLRAGVKSARARLARRTDLRCHEL